MVIRDLKTVCVRCQGSGRLAGLPSLGITQINYAGECPQCRGRGFLLTELGQDLVNLLRPFVEEWIERRQPERSGHPSAPPGGS